jgi:hypothetical protein
MKKEFDKEIFKEMILYISERCKDKPHFDTAHLEKILHYSDFFWYGHTGVSISGETYLRQQHGPTPKHLEEALEELVRDGFLEVVKKPRVDYTQRKPVIKKSFELNKLSKEQAEFIDTVIVDLVDLAIAREDIFWQYLSNGEEIPYETVFFRRRKTLSPSEIDEAQDFIDRYEKRLKEKNHVAV